MIAGGVAEILSSVMGGRWEFQKLSSEHRKPRPTLCGMGAGAHIVSEQGIVEAYVNSISTSSYGNRPRGRTRHISRSRNLRLGPAVPEREGERAEDARWSCMYVCKIETTRKERNLRSVGYKRRITERLYIFRPTMVPTFCPSGSLLSPPLSLPGSPPHRCNPCVVPAVVPLVDSPPSIPISTCQQWGWMWLRDISLGQFSKRCSMVSHF